MDAHKVFAEMSTQHEVTMSSVIHISVIHMVYPVTEGVLQQVFELYGCGVTRLAVFQGNCWVEATVQLRSGHEAVYARDALNGRNIYDGCCTISIECTPTSSPSHASNLPEEHVLTMASTMTTAVAPPMSSTPVVDALVVSLHKPSNGTTSTGAQKVFAETSLSPAQSSNLDVVNPTVAPTSVVGGQQSMVIAAVMDMADATLVVENPFVAAPRCQEKVQPQRALKVFDAMCEVSNSKKKPSRIIKWVSGVPITRRPVRWTARRKYQNSSRSPPPPRPPEQPFSDQVPAPKLPLWPSLQFVVPQFKCSRELMLAATQPWCRSAFSPGYKEQQHMVCMLGDYRQRSLQNKSDGDNLASPITLQKMKNYEEICEK